MAESHTNETIPLVKDFMTPWPHTIGEDQSLRFARDFMQQNRIRHLPVLDGGELVGILSEREIGVVENIPGVDLNQFTVREVFSPNPYCTNQTTSLEQVCREMAASKNACALIVEDKMLVGIFTWVDGLKALAKLLEKSRSHPES